MAAFNVPAFTRGISGLLTAREEGKREAEDRAKKQQSQAVVDLLRQQQAKELQDRGRRARERREADAARATADKEALEQGQRQRADFILSQLGEEDLQGVQGFESQTLADQLKTLETALRRQRTKVDRVSRRPEPTDEEKRRKSVEGAARRLVASGEATDFGEALGMAGDRMSTEEAASSRFFDSGSTVNPLEQQARQSLIAVAQQKLTAAQGNGELEQEILDRLREALKQLPTESDEGLQRFLQRVQTSEQVPGAGGRF